MPGLLCVLYPLLAWSAGDSEPDAWRPYAPGTITAGGYLGGGLSLQGAPRNARVFALFPRAGYVLAEQPHLLPGSVELVAEPGYMTVWHTQAAHVFSFSLFAKYNLRAGTRWTPFVEFGAGVSEATRPVPGVRGSRFNFVLQPGLGVAYALAGRTTAAFEWRYNHLSNARIYSTDPSLNTSIFLLGVAQHFCGPTKRGIGQWQRLASAHRDGLPRQDVCIKALSAEDARATRLHRPIG